MTAAAGPRHVDAGVVGHAGADAGDHPVVRTPDEAAVLVVWVVLIGRSPSGHRVLPGRRGRRVLQGQRVLQGPGFCRVGRFCRLGRLGRGHGGGVVVRGGRLARRGPASRPGRRTPGRRDGSPRPGPTALGADPAALAGLVGLPVRSLRRVVAISPATPASTHGTGSSQRMSSPVTASDSTRIQIKTMPEKAIPITKWPMLIGWRPLRVAAPVARVSTVLMSDLPEGLGTDFDVAHVDLEVQRELGDAGAAVEVLAVGRVDATGLLAEEGVPARAVDLRVHGDIHVRRCDDASSPKSPLRLIVRSSRASGSSQVCQVEQVLPGREVVAVQDLVCRRGATDDGLVGFHLFHTHADGGGAAASRPTRIRPPARP